MSLYIRMRLSGIIAVGLALCLPYAAADEPPCHGGDAGVGSVEHVGNYSRSFASYAVPEVMLKNQNSEDVSLSELLGQPGPLAVNFVFTTCTTICPVMTATFSQLQKELGADGDELQFVSISIDPEFDTPAVLREYARRFGARESWQFLTGDARKISRVLSAFNALDGSKMNHEPFTLFHVPGEERWIRIDGLTSGADLAGEYRRLVTR